MEHVYGVLCTELRDERLKRWDVYFDSKKEDEDDETCANYCTRAFRETRKTWTTMKLSFLSAEIVDDIRRAMGWICDQRPNSEFIPWRRNRRDVWGQEGLLNGWEMKTGSVKEQDVRHWKTRKDSFPFALRSVNHSTIRRTRFAKKKKKMRRQKYPKYWDPTDRIIHILWRWICSAVMWRQWDCGEVDRRPVCSG